MIPSKYAQHCTLEFGPLSSQPIRLNFNASPFGVAFEDLSSHACSIRTALRNGELELRMLLTIS